MTAIAGGLRDRLIRDAVAITVRAGLDQLGWFGGGRRHAPIDWRDNAVTEADETVPPNTITVSSEDMRGEAAELGSEATEDRHQFWVDFYAESEDVGKEMIGDVRDILRGQHPDAGRTGSAIGVYDLTQNPVPTDPAFYVEVENVDVDRARDTTRPWEQFWFACSFEVVDSK